jgi:hypothetical protein
MADTKLEKGSARDKVAVFVEQAKQKLGPAFAIGMDLLFRATPFIEKGWTKYQEIEAKVPADYFWMLYGVGLCFFGGVFSATIAAVETFRMHGWNKVKPCLLELQKDYYEVMKAHKEDELRDDDQDGTPDTKQITAQQLAQRKFFLVLRSIEPERVTRALDGIFVGLFAAFTVLKVQFAMVVSLALSIGDNMRKPAMFFFLPILNAVVPQAYAKWNPIVINYACKVFACSIAWVLQTIISSVQSGIKGGLIVARSALRIAVQRGFLASFDENESYLDEVIGWSLALLGVYIQLSNWFTLPFPFNILLLPLSINEWFLRWAIVEY